MSVIELKNAVIRPLADVAKKSLFKQPLNLSIKENERWAVTGTHKTSLLQTLASKHLSDPPQSRRYPFLGKEFWPSQVTQLVEFGSTDIKASHLSARYESFRDEFDNSLLDYLRQATRDEGQLQKVLDQFMLKGIEDRWVVGLSNGQNRRARLAHSILKGPRLLFVDEPFLGLDPPSREKVSSVLEGLPPKPHVVLGLRIQDEFPSWITHVAITDPDGISHQGPMKEMLPELSRLREEHFTRVNKNKSKGNSQVVDEKVIELDNVTVGYRGEIVFKDLSFTAKRGEKWHLQGPNGSGKSTLLSLITADHPQSWNSKIKLFGEPRKTGKQSYFGINENIGHASPEIHAIFPTNLTTRQAIATGFVVGSFIPPKRLTEAQESRVNYLLSDFELDPETPLNQLPLADQKIVMFLRAIAKIPDILILDEAFSAMDEDQTEQCKNMVRDYHGTVIAVAHLESEVPDCDKFIRFTSNGVVQGHL